MKEQLVDWLLARDLSPAVADIITYLILVIAVLVAAFVANYLAKKILLGAITALVKRSRTTWDDALDKRNVFLRLSHLAPATVVYASASMFSGWEDILQRVSIVYMILAGLLVISAFFNAVDDVYRSYDVSRNRPIKGYLQVAKIVLAVMVCVTAVAVLMDQSPVMLLSGIGAMTAVLILVFKDTILGLVAGIQLSMNDMVRIGDWVEMPQFNADGDVIDISLHTVKVQNWDKTITSIPTYAMISGSFKNWRGMTESGGRRIKRSLLIDMESIKFCDEQLLKKFTKFELLNDYVAARAKEIVEYNQSRKVDESELINGRRMTNVGTFRAYVKAYLKNHPKIHQGMTFLVRQLPPSEHGLPLEIYVFSNDQAWVNYEDIQADIFDHLLASLPLFDLRLYQSPSNAAIEQLARQTVGRS